jgi:hypothetical protein
MNYRLAIARDTEHACSVYASRIVTPALIYIHIYIYTYVLKISIESTKHWARAVRSPISFKFVAEFVAAIPLPGISITEPSIRIRIHLQSGSSTCERYSWRFESALSNPHALGGLESN